MRHSFNNSGFTLVELIVAMTVMAILSPLVFGSLWDYYDSNVISVGKTTLNSYTIGTLRQIEADISNGSGFLDMVSVAAPFGPTTSNNTWSYNADPSSNSNNVLIVKTYATNSTNSQLVFTNVSGSGCVPGTDLPMNNLLIYYIGQDIHNSSQYNLYRHTVVNWDQKPTCSGTTPLQKNSCVLTMISNSSCQAADATIMSNVSSLKLTFYATSTSTTPLTGSQIPTAQTVQIDVQANSSDKRIPTSSSSLRINEIAL